MPVTYQGHTFPDYDHPIPSDKADKKYMVLVRRGERVALVHFGQKGYQHNYSEAAKQNYLARSAGIRDKDGNLTKDDPFSPNYWARRYLWPDGKADGGTAAHKEGSADAAGGEAPEQDSATLFLAGLLRDEDDDLDEGNRDDSGFVGPEEDPNHDGVSWGLD